MNDIWKQIDELIEEWNKIQQQRMQGCISEAEREKIESQIEREKWFMIFEYLKGRECEEVEIREIEEDKEI